MIADASEVADLLQRLDRRLDDLRQISRASADAAQSGSSEYRHETMVDAYRAMINIISLVAPLRRAVMSYDCLGPVLSITELALRTTRLVALGLLPVASQSVRDSIAEPDERARLERRMFALQQETHRIGLLWVPHRARLKPGAARLGDSWDAYVVATRSAWRYWTHLRSDAELGRALRRGMSRSMPTSLRAACATLLTIINVQQFGRVDVDAYQALGSTSVSGWLNDAAKRCE